VRLDCWVVGDSQFDVRRGEDLEFRSQVASCTGEDKRNWQLNSVEDIMFGCV
jgi:hypothetical protein